MMARCRTEMDEELQQAAVKLSLEQAVRAQQQAYRGVEPHKVDSPNELSVAGGVGQLPPQDLMRGRPQVQGVLRNPLLTCQVPRRLAR